MTPAREQRRCNESLWNCYGIYHGERPFCYTWPFPNCMRQFQAGFDVHTKEDKRQTIGDSKHWNNRGYKTVGTKVYNSRKKSLTNRRIQVSLQMTMNEVSKLVSNQFWISTRRHSPKYRSVSVSIHSNKNSGILASAYSHDMNIAGAVEEVKTLVEASKEE